MRALIRAQHATVLASIPEPRADAGEVVVEVAFAGVCRTDLAVADGAIAVAPGRVLGHELAGWRVDTGERVTVIPFAPCGACGCAGGARCVRPAWLGIDRDGAFAERVVVPAACVLPLPAGMSLVHGAYVEPVAAALGVLPVIERGHRVLVAGDGRIAELTARVVAAHGAHVERLPVSTDRDPAASRPLDGRHAAFDVVIEHAGDAAALLPYVRGGGTLLLKSRARAPLALDAGELVARDLAVRGVSHGSFAAAIDWLHAGRIVVDDLLAPPRPLDAFAEVFAAARASEAHKQLFAIAERA